MNVLVVAATQPEIEPLQIRLSTDHAIHDVHYLITGAGMVATAYALTRQLSSLRYDLVIDAGIAGSFDRSISLGEVTEVIEDRFSEMGAEDGNQFLSMKDIGMQGDEPLSPKRTIDIPPPLSLRKVSAVTVNTVHGDHASIERLQRRVPAQLESMEGAAVFYVCERENMPCLQVRAVSNYIEKRNRESWEVKKAIGNLNEWLYRLLITIQAR